MGAVFSRIKTWISLEDLTAANLNAEFDNILNNLVPDQLDDHSQNVAEMQEQTDPGEVGSESLATSLGGEIERIRTILSEVTGETYWYESPDASLKELNSIGSSTGNRIVSGLVRTDSDQIVALDPDGTAATVVLRGLATNFVYKINGVQYAVSTDVSLTSLQTAPSSNNTALVDDTSLTNQLSSKLVGENGTTLTIKTVGSEISTLVGSRAAFKLAGVGTEYFTAYVASATTLTKIRRGYFFDDTASPIERTAMSDGDTITLMKLTWVFINEAGVLNASYVEPIVDETEPTPVIGQYWFDLANDTWMLGNGASFESAGAIPIGYCFQDSTGCLGARNFYQFATHVQIQTVSLEYVDATTIRSDAYDSTIGIFGNTITYKDDQIDWDITANLDSGVSEAASTIYYAYLNQNGKAILSDVAPYDQTDDLLGFYHPHQLWRCIGSIENDGSQDFDSSTLLGYGQIKAAEIQSKSITADQIADEGITTEVIEDGAVTKDKLSTSNHEISLSTGTYSFVGVAENDITNATVTITTNGRPVLLGLIGETSASPYNNSYLRMSGTDPQISIIFYRDSTVISHNWCREVGVTLHEFAMGTFTHLDVPAAGTYTYKLAAYSSSPDYTFQIKNMKFYACEL